MTKLSLLRRHEREGTVRALGDTDRQATSEHSGRPDGSAPDTGHNEIRPLGVNQGGTAEYLLRFAPEPTGAERFYLPTPENF